MLYEVITGASEKPERYSFKAIRALRSHGHEVVALAPRPGKVEDVVFETQPLPFDGIDTVTLYLGPQNQQPYVEYILQRNNFV